MTAFAILTAVILATAYTVTAVTCWLEDDARTQPHTAQTTEKP